MMTEFDSKELKAVASAFKAMQTVARKRSLFGGVCYLEDGRVLFVCDLDYVNPHAMFHVRFALKPSSEVSNLHERKSAYFLISEFVNAVSRAKPSGTIAFEILPNGGAQILADGTRFHLEPQGERVVRMLLGQDLSENIVITEHRKVSDLKFLDELGVSELERAFEFVLPAVGPDPSTVRGRMLWEFHGHGCFRVVGTDGKRIHFADMGMCSKKMAPQDKSVVLAPYAANIMMHAFSVLTKKPQGPVPPKVRVSRGVVKYSNDLQYSCVQLADTENRLVMYIAFPDEPWINYNNSLNWVLYARDHVPVRLDKKAVQKALAFFNKAARHGKKKDVIPVDFYCLQNSNRIRLLLDYNGMIAEDEIETIKQNQREFNVGMNARMTADALSLVRGNECAILFKADEELPVNPYLIKHKDELGEYRSLISPINPDWSRC
jgi:hypothetical protein